MFFHVILTTECNSHCRYCYGEAIEDTDDGPSDFEIDYSLPRKISYEIDLLRRFCSKDPHCVLTFYGGEPLLCIDEIRRVMDTVNAGLFMIQTNGLLLHRLEKSYVNRFHTILVSIDGDEALTDFYRGEGTFRKVVENLRLVKRNGFEGEVIARMTVMESTDIYRQVRWLLENDDYAFSSVHWQLNAGFWRNDFARRDFRRWSEESYVPGVGRLAEFWVDYMEKKGVVLRLYPLLGLAHSILFGEEASFLRCGGGWINYAIQTDGNIVPCPTMWGIKDYYVGHVGKADPLRLDRVFVKDPCESCDALGLCGGRCLYANAMKRWGPEAYSQVCNTVKHLAEAVVAQLPKIRELIDEGKIGLRDFEYVRYNGCEIIP